MFAARLRPLSLAGTSTPQPARAREPGRRRAALRDLGEEPAQAPQYGVIAKGSL